ncbi:MAG: hypothetical protein RIQ87_620 [Chloroflexota bacterium]|jgi:hypothetical protein|nr:MAG: hypothetical protein DWI46_02705 [Chloroflexota bacterium]
MIEPAPLLLALAALAALMVGRLLGSRASFPIALAAAAVGALLGQGIGSGLFGGLLSVGGVAWPAPVLGALLFERFAARVATDWRRGQES